MGVDLVTFFITAFQL